MRLNDMSKDALIEVMRLVNDGRVGDTGRTSKSQYIQMLTEDFDRDEVVKAIDNIEQKLTATGMSRPLSLSSVRTPTPEAAKQLADALAAMMAPQAVEVAEVNPDMVRQIVREEINNIAPRRLDVVIEGRHNTVGDFPHPMFEKVLRLAQVGLNVLMVGSAGAGKTYLAAQVARVLGHDYGQISCTAGMSESELVGWLMPIGEAGRFEYMPAQFVSMYEKGNSLFLFDELDAADSNTMLVMNTALSNGEIHVPRRHTNPVFKRGENQVLMATANTYGTGADMVYAGRNVLDAATLDRFYVVNIDYNEALEASIMGQPRPEEKTAPWKAASVETLDKDMATLHETIAAIRDLATTNKLRRVVSTRAFQKAALARRAGIPLNEILIDLLAGWSRDELAKVGIK